MTQRQTVDAEVSAPSASSSRPSHSHQPWVSSVVANFAARFCALLSAVVVARVLGPDSRGVLAAAMLWPTMVEHASVINVPTVTYFAAKKGGLGLAACAWIGVAMAVVLVPLSLAVNSVALGDRPDIRLYANWFTAIIPLMIASKLVGGLLLTQERIGAFWSMRVMTTLLTAIGAPLMVLLGVLSVGSYLALFVAATAVGVVVAYQLREQAALRRSSESIQSLAPDVLKFGARTLITSSAAQLNLRLDQLVVSVMLPAAVLGGYAVALSWASAVYVVSSALSAVVLSKTSRSNIVDVESRDHAVARVRRTGILSVGVAVLVAALAPFAVPLVFGRQYTDAVTPAVLLSLAAGAIGWKGFLHEFARGMGTPSTGRLPELVGLGIRSIGLALLLADWGGTGAAFAALVSSVAILATFAVRMGRTVALPPRAFLPGLADLRFLVNAGADYLRHHRARVRRISA